MKDDDNYRKQKAWLDKIETKLLARGELKHLGDIYEHQRYKVGCVPPFRYRRERYVEPVKNT